MNQVLYVGDKCNNNCWSCEYKRVNKSYEQLSDELSKYSPDRPLLVTGGEPFLFPEFLKLLKSTKKFKDVKILTNGRIFSHLGNVPQDFHSSLYIKVLGFDAESHDKLTRAPGSFNQTVRGVVNLVKSGVKANIVIPMLEQNFTLIPAIVRKFNKKGIQKIILVFPDDHKNETSISLSEIRSILTEALEISWKVKLGNLPCCILRQYADRHENWGTGPDVAAKECDVCYFSQECPKLPKTYIQKYRDHEIEVFNYPSEVILEITSECNKSCSFCFNRIYYGNKTKIMTYPEFKNIVSKFPAEIDQLRITGGEPLMHADFSKIINFAHNRGFRVWLNTNGKYFNDENLNLIGKTCENVLIGINDYKDLENIGPHIKLLKRYDLKKRLGSVITSTLIANLEKFFIKVHELQVDDWEFYRPIVKSNGLNRKELGIFLQKLGKLNLFFRTRYKIANAIPFCVNGFSDQLQKLSVGAIADDGHIRFVIGADGLARPSYHITKIVGDAKKEDIVSLWNSDFMIKLRNLRLVPDRCKGCHLLIRCKGGSRTMSSLVGDNYSSEDNII